MSDTQHYLAMIHRIKENREQYNIIEINNAIHQIETYFKAANIKKTTHKNFIHTFDYNSLFDTGYSQFVKILEQIDADE